jgi:hypothetical protein
MPEKQGEPDLRSLVPPVVVEDVQAGPVELRRGFKLRPPALGAKIKGQGRFVPPGNTESAREG